MFDIQWNGQSHGTYEDHQRAIKAAETFCNDYGLDPAECYADYLSDTDDAGLWMLAEGYAVIALTEGWCRKVYNFDLVWR